MATDKILGVGGLGGLYPALHKYAKCHYNGSDYDNGDIVSIVLKNFNLKIVPKWIMIVFFAH